MATITYASTPNSLKTALKTSGRLWGTLGLPLIQRIAGKEAINMYKTLDSANQIVAGVTEGERIGYTRQAAVNQVSGYNGTNHYSLAFGNSANLLNRSELAFFGGFGYLGNNPTDESNWSIRPEINVIDFLYNNGESEFGYDANAIYNNSSKRSKIQSVISQAKNSFPSCFISNYSFANSMDSIGSYTTFFFNANPSSANNLISLINSQNYNCRPLDLGFDANVYSNYDNPETRYPEWYLPLSIEITKKKYPNKKHLAAPWIIFETLGFYPQLNTVRKQANGSLVNIEPLQKQEASLRFIYNTILISLVLGDGFILWNESERTYEVANPDENIGAINSTLGTMQNVELRNSRRWLGMNLIASEAMMHASQFKAEIENATPFTKPDFSFNGGSLITGNNKEVIYSKINNTPFVYSKDLGSNSHLVLACLPNQADNVVSFVTVHNKKVLLKGGKATICKIEGAGTVVNPPVNEELGMTTVYTNGTSYVKFKNFADFQQNLAGANHPDTVNNLMPFNLPTWVYSYQLANNPNSNSKQRYKLYNPDGVLVYTYYDDIGNQNQEASGAPMLSRGDNHNETISAYKGKPGIYTITVEVLAGSTDPGQLYFWDQSPTLGTKMLVADVVTGIWNDNVTFANFIEIPVGATVTRQFTLAAHSEINRIVKSSANIQ